jgi:hypothetical protein
MTLFFASLPPLGLSVPVVHLGHDPLDGHAHKRGGQQHYKDNRRHIIYGNRRTNLPFHFSAPFRTYFPSSIFDISIKKQEVQAVLVTSRFSSGSFSPTTVSQ